MEKFNIGEVRSRKALLFVLGTPWSRSDRGAVKLEKAVNAGEPCLHTARQRSSVLSLTRSSLEQSRSKSQKSPRLRKQSKWQGTSHSLSIGEVGADVLDVLRISFGSRVGQFSFSYYFVV